MYDSDANLVKNTTYKYVRFENKAGERTGRRNNVSVASMAARVIRQTELFQPKAVENFIEPAGMVGRHERGICLHFFDVSLSSFLWPTSSVVSTVHIPYVYSK